jgi:hypothetical protein
MTFSVIFHKNGKKNRQNAVGSHTSSSEEIWELVYFYCL